MSATIIVKIQKVGKIAQVDEIEREQTFFGLRKNVLMTSNVFVDFSFIMKINDGNLLISLSQMNGEFGKNKRPIFELTITSTKQPVLLCKTCYSKSKCMD